MSEKKRAATTQDSDCPPAVSHLVGVLVLLAVPVVQRTPANLVPALLRTDHPPALLADDEQGYSGGENAARDSHALVFPGAEYVLDGNHVWVGVTKFAGTVVDAVHEKNDGNHVTCAGKCLAARLRGAPG